MRGHHRLYIWMAVRQGLLGLDLDLRGWALLYIYVDQLCAGVAMLRHLPASTQSGLVLAHRTLDAAVHGNGHCSGATEGELARRWVCILFCLTH